MTSSERSNNGHKNVPSPNGTKNVASPNGTKNVASPNGVKNVASPNGDKAANAYARFIPREELGGFAAWQPGALGGAPAPQPGVQREAKEAPKPPAAEQLAVQLRAARQAGYQDGYRDGLVALDSFKQSFATQATAQIGALLEALDAELGGLQQQMARTLAVTATQLARQIVRSQLAIDPACVAQVADEAVEALLLAARHITLRVHPDDHPLVSEGAGEVIAARGARLVDDASIRRGGVLVDSDIGVVDATLETRWLRATASLGCEAPWSEGEKSA